MGTAGIEARARGVARPRRVVLRELAATSRPLTIAAFATVAVSAALPVAFAVANGAVVGAIAPALGAGSLATSEGRRLVMAVLVVAALFAAGHCLQPVQDMVRAMLARRVQGRTYRRSMVAALQPRTIAHLEEPQLQDLVAAATILTPSGPSGAVRGVFRELGNVLAGLGGLFLVAHYRVWLALLLLVAEVHALRVNRAVFNQLTAFRAVRMPGLRRSVYLRNVGMNAEAAKENRVFGLAGWVVHRFRGAWLVTMREVWDDRRGNARRLATATAPLLALVALAAWMLAGDAAGGRIGVGAMVAYASAIVTSLQLCIAGGGVSVEEGAAVMDATARLERAVSTDERLQLPGGGAPSPGAPRREIRFEGVGFRYPGRDTDVLRDLDLTIPAGGSLALVGDNGAGKTTLVKLLARLYDPTAGRILVDGADLRDLDPTAWQLRIAAVFQDFVRYPLTAAANVAMGAGSTDRNGALDEAAHRAGALDLVAGLPYGWDTVLTREFEGGVDLSGGEWQRIALARALFASRARRAGLLILDEPTAHLDARAEAAFIDTFLDVTRGCTTIVISHRFSTVRRAGRVAVLDGGRITESGTHDELLAAGGRYARMFALQAGRFADG